MFTRQDRRNADALKATFVAAAVGAVLTLTAFAGSAQADSVASSMATVNQTANGQMTSDYCTASLPALQQAADGGQSGHLEALKTLETCDTLLGKTSAATFVDWQISRELDRADPHDE